MKTKYAYRVEAVLQGELGVTEFWQRYVTTTVLAEDALLHSSAAWNKLSAIVEAQFYESSAKKWGNGWNELHIVNVWRVPEEDVPSSVITHMNDTSSDDLRARE